MNLREQFQKLHPVPDCVYWCEQVYLYGLKVPAEVGTDTWIECYGYNSLWQGFQFGHAAGLEQQAKRITELEASLADSNEALQVMGLLLSDADAVNSQLVTEAAHNTKMIEAGSRRDECKINLIKKQNEQIAALKKKLRDEYDDYPADELQDQSHSANTVGGPTPVMDAAPACEPERSVSESIAAGHPCFDPDGPPDHDWEYVDDSFSHEFGTEICGHYECARCNAIKPE